MQSSTGSKTIFRVAFFEKPYLKGVFLERIPAVQQNSNFLTELFYLGDVVVDSLLAPLSSVVKRLKETDLVRDSSQ